MRLLRIKEGCGLELSDDLEEDDIPPYAILSQTWGADKEEVPFKDLKEGSGNPKSGYHKLEFCAEQTRRDGLTHSWVDTCCIDKSNNVELNTAITSMFRWYQRAAECYVHLPDVLKNYADSNGSYDVTWQSDFRDCRWLTRGLTLQELLAPKTVDF